MRPDRGGWSWVPGSRPSGRAPEWPHDGTSAIGGEPRIDRPLLDLVKLGAGLDEFLGLLSHPALRIVADLLGDLHRAELGPTHRAEMRELGALGRQGLVVELLGRLRVERQVELVAPAELEARPRQRVVAFAP